jgi:dUTP pyrophosphatase
MDIQIKFKRTEKAKQLDLKPIKHYRGDAGFDLPICWDFTGEKASSQVNPGQIIDVPTGLYIQLPAGYWAEIKARGSSFLKKDLHIHDAVMDNGFTGEWRVGLRNIGNKPIVLSDGDSVAQMILHRIIGAELVEVNELSETDRGFGQLGSTDKK